MKKLLGIWRLIRVNWDLPINQSSGSGGGGDVCNCDITLDNFVTLSNKSMDFNSNHFTNFPLIGATTISALTDTNISSPQGRQTLKYNATSSKWENSYSTPGIAFSYAMSALQTFPAGDDTDLIFNLAVGPSTLNDDSCYNPSTGVFTPSVNGYYQIDVSVGFQGTSDTSMTQLYIGNVGVVSSVKNAATVFYLKYSGLRYVSASAPLFFGVQSNASISIFASPDNTTFSAFLVRAT